MLYKLNKPADNDAKYKITNLEHMYVFHFNYSYVDNVLTFADLSSELYKFNLIKTIRSLIFIVYLIILINKHAYTLDLVVACQWYADKRIKFIGPCVYFGTTFSVFILSSDRRLK